MAHYKLQKKETEIMVLIYHDDVEEESELIKDFNRKYLPSLTDQEIKVITFKKLCKGIGLLFQKRTVFDNDWNICL